jgi:tripartite-type tricarboxylate transporter receptor subunit TctC
LKDVDMTADMPQMEFSRRKLMRLAMSAVAIPVLSGVEIVQPYPARPVRVIVGLAAGTSPDIIARVFG